MPRPHRVDYEDAWHHVMNRGVARHAIFFSDRDRELFFDCLARASIESSVEVYGYCLMNNHFHLLVRSVEGRLSTFLKQFSGRYTRGVNKLAGRDGPLFRGRAHTVLIRDNSQLVQTSRYIHLNPVITGSCSRPEDWKWSSARSFLKIEAPVSWLHTNMILEMFETATPGGDYRNFLKDGIDLASAEFYSKLKWSEVE